MSREDIELDLYPLGSSIYELSEGRMAFVVILWPGDISELWRAFDGALGSDGSNHPEPTGE